MSRAGAAVGSAVFLVIAPGVMAGLVPWLLTGWQADDWSLPLRVLGSVMIVVGVAVLVHAFSRFVIEGLGTPAPVAPTERLVVGGAYRYVRNPMYVAVISIIAGQSLLLGRPVLLVYATAFWALVAAFVYGYEQPALRRRFGAEYEEYARAVPAWWPRRSPWDGAATRRD